MELAMVAAGFTPGRGRPAAPLDGGVEAERRPGAVRGAAEEAACRRNGYSARIRRGDLPADPRLRRVRLSGIALGELRAAGLRLVLDQVPPSGGVLRRAAQQPADGLLRARRSWCRTRAATASRCARRTCRSSDWDCTLEDGARAPGAAHGERPVRSRRAGASPPGRPLCARAASLKLNRKDLRCLAAAGALQSLAGHRRLARLGGGRRGAPRAARRAGAGAHAGSSRRPREGEEIVADYASLGLTLGRHPAGLAAGAASRSCRLLDAQSLHRLAHGARAQAAGLVTCRQRPDTASGVVFVTLEDETGCINVVVWRNLVETPARASCSARACSACRA